MGRRPNIPPPLKKRPFTLAEARAAGLTHDSLRGKSWRRLGAELYCWRGFDGDPWKLIAAWQRLLPTHAIFAGPTAAWLWGSAPIRQTRSRSSFLQQHLSEPGMGFAFDAASLMKTTSKK